MAINRETRRAIAKAPAKKTTTRSTAAKRTTAKVETKASVGKVGSPKKVSTAAEWKKSTDNGVTLEVPSGQVCRAKRPGMKEFLRKGMIPNNLMPIIEEAITDNKGPKKPSEMKEMMSGINLEEVMELVDAITVAVVIEPDIQAITYEDGDGNIVELEDDEREADEIYVDDVDFDDRMFIFQWAVGGSADVEQFREQQKEMLGALSAG